MTAKDAVNQYIDALNAKDSEALRETLAEDMESYGLFGVEDPVQGRDMYVEVMNGLFEAFPDLEFETSTIIAEGDTAAARWTLTGTQEGSFGDLPPSGNEVHVDGNAIFHVEDDKITEKRYRQDDLGMLEQLGMDLEV